MSDGFPALSPSLLPPGFYREAGRACAVYVQNGGRLREIRMDETQLSQSPLQLTPPPRGNRDLFPLRRELEEDLHHIQQRWCEESGTSTYQGLHFLFAFCYEMERKTPGWKNWARIWLRENQARFRQSVYQHYHQYLLNPRERKKAVLGCWEPQPELDPAGLKDLLEEKMALDVSSLSQSQRAVVIQSELLGQTVIIKRYAPNPQGWKRKWEHSRARRAWAASKTLGTLGLPAIQGLGWLECYKNGCLQESYFISRQLTEMETLRAWLRREFPKMNARERSRFRHRLRREILKLQACGLKHVDLKLSNLLIKGREVEDLNFYWIDLEDLRTGHYSKRSFIRNLYQLNGSLPRKIPREEREAFVAGFRTLFKIAGSRQLLRYIQNKTRKRHRDELNRRQGA